MRRRRALLLALLAPACAPSTTASLPEPPSEAPPVALVPGQIPAPATAAEVAVSPPEPQVMRVQNLLISRLGRSERRFRDTFGELAGTAPVVYAVPVRAGQCYQVFVSADAAAGDLGVRLLDPAVLLESDGRYGAYAMLGQRQALCASRDGAWRLEVTGAQGRGRFVVSVISRSGADEAARASLRAWSGE